MKTFSLAGVSIGDRHPVRIMGVINASPESFFKGSVRTSARAIRALAKRMEDDGADFIDVGAMSSAPYLKTQISEADEARRLTRAIEIISAATRLPISVDSFREGPALAGLHAGAKILNDITGLAGDPAMADVARRAKGVILMAHPMSLNKSAKTASPTRAVKEILRAALQRAAQVSIPKSSIAIDPGIGFFRTTRWPWWQWDIAVLRELPALLTLGQPLLIGVSRKSFIGEILKIKNPMDRLAGSVSATAWAVMNGATIIRTHDVRETREAVRVVERLLGRR